MDISQLAPGYQIENKYIQARIVPAGYVSGVQAGGFLDKRTGARDLGWGLDIADFLLEPVRDEKPAAKAKKGGEPETPELYRADERVHGRMPKRYVEGPQICTQARQLPIELIAGQGFAAVRQRWQWQWATYGRQAGSTWEQTLLFLEDKRYFLAADRITSVNAVDKLIFRTDLPGHIKHNQGDTFQQIYLSYEGYLPCEEFFEPFAPDARFLYSREADPTPERMIRAYQLRDPKGVGPWLAGMTLDPESVWEAWCHARRHNPDDPDSPTYVCMIQEIGGSPVQPGEPFGAAYVIGYFDSVEDMETVYDRHKGHTAIEVDKDGWELV